MRWRPGSACPPYRFTPSSVWVTPSAHPQPRLRSTHRPISARCSRACSPPGWPWSARFSSTRSLFRVCGSVSFWRVSAWARPISGASPPRILTEPRLSARIARTTWTGRSSSGCSAAASNWLATGCGTPTAAKDEVEAQLGYRDRRRFRGDIKRFGRFSPLELKTLRLLGDKEADHQASVPFWFPDQEARLARGRQNARELFTLVTVAPTKRDQHTLLRKYSDDRPEATWTPADVYQPVPPRLAEAAVEDHQGTLPDNVVTWERVEKWRIGEFSLQCGSQSLALAA